MDKAFINIHEVLQALEEGFLVELILKTNRSVGILKSHNGVFRIFGVSEIMFKDPIEAASFIEGLVLGAKCAQYFTKEEAMDLADSGYFLRDIK